MPSASAFTIDSSSLTFGKVLARGSAPGITVYQAELQLGKHSIQVAVKRLDTSQAEAAVKELFLEEINTVQFASATCHRTCRILGCCQLGDDICLVMNLYPQTAANLLANAKGALSLPVVIAMAVDVLEGLMQLHGSKPKVLHLDLKPPNILLDEHGHAYLSDFGISRALQTLESCPAVTSLSGTPHYMSPEQADADFGIRGPHTDIWGFAACVLHLASGRLPYQGLSLPQMITAMLKRRPPDVPATLPAWLQQALRQSLVFDTAARPSLEQLLQVFKEQLNLPYSASSVTPVNAANDGRPVVALDNSLTAQDVSTPQPAHVRRFSYKRGQGKQRQFRLASAMRRQHAADRRSGLQQAAAPDRHVPVPRNGSDCRLLDGRRRPVTNDSDTTSASDSSSASDTSSDTEASCYDI